MKTKVIVAVVVAVVVVVGGVFYFVDRVQAPPAPQSMPEIPAPTSTAPTTLPTSTTPTNTTPTSTAGGYLSPTSGLVGTTVTIHGSGFSNDNTILMDGLVSSSMKDVASPDGTTLTFQVPGSLGPNCGPDQACPAFAMLVTARTYSISVVTGSVTQTIGKFTVTGGGIQAPQ